MLEVQTAVAKINKYATSESGDTVEVIERPRGGLSIVMADGQRSGRSAKAISNMVVRKAVSLLGEGVRDGAVARATHDYLHAQRGGQVSAELVIVSVDLVTRTLVISRNSRCPSLLRRGAELIWLADDSDAVGVRLNTKPAISEFELAAETLLVVMSDGVSAAGVRSGDTLDLPALLQQVDAGGCAPANVIADAILAEALRLEKGRPHDDATVLVLKIVTQDEPDPVRRLAMRFPIQ
jgi:serine phosphatase RsbU (regulator of sigma subunit)